MHGRGNDASLNKVQTDEGDNFMRTLSLFDSQSSPEALEPKLSLSSFSAVSAPPHVLPIQATSLNHNAPLPDPEPPIPYPVEDPPMFPSLPPSGPAGPGS